MLKFILGRPSSGKTFEILKKIRELAEDGRECVLIVPEQFSFESERAVLHALGDKATERVTVAGFTRLCDIVGRLAGGIAAMPLTDAQRIIFMSRALRLAKPELKLWRRYCGSAAFAETMLDTVGEFKINAVFPAELRAAADGTESPMLKNKLFDTALIYETYDAVTGESFIDPADNLTRLYRQLEKCRFFENKVVFLDSFKGFTGQQLAIINRILSQADGLYAAFTDAPEKNGEFGLFSNIRQTEERLRRAAARYGIAEEKPLILNGGKNVAEGIAAVERLISGEEICYDGADGAVTVCSAATPADEAEFAAESIRRLVRTEGYRYRDFVIIVRNGEQYEDFVTAACRQNGIPCFTDRRRPLTAFPLAAAGAAALETAIKKSSESILRFHKTGLGTLTTEEISLLENYIFLWNIDGKRWETEWDMDPRGFVFDGDGKGADGEALEKINALRKKAWVPLESFKNKLGDSAESIAAALVELFEECNAADKLSKMSERLLSADDGFSADFLRQGYDKYMRLLDGITVCYGKRTVDLREFADTLRLAVGFETVGAVPRTLDEITFGSADRIRPSRPRAAFIMGANQGVFPKNVSAAGIFGTAERKSLIELGLEIPDRALSSVTDENYLVYCNLCCPSDRLFVSYARGGLSGEVMQPSVFVGEITENTGCKSVSVPYTVLEAEAPPETAESAYSQYCRRITKPASGAAELKTALCGTELYGKILYADERLENGEKRISREAAAELFGQNIKMSASRFDSFSRCRFGFFCRYGLGVKRLQPADFDVLQRGTAVHYCLERLIKDYGKDVSKLKKEETDRLTDEYMADYLDGIAGYCSVETARSRFLAERIARAVKEVAHRLALEFAQSDFEPAACELEIENAEFPFDGGHLLLSGSIDRVDTCRGYIRVIDYKTGSRKFKLPDILFGLNMQMLIYLYCAVRGSGLPDESAAGILYLPSKRDTTGGGMAMNGLLRREEEIVTAMDREHCGEFIPKYSLTKSGELKKTCNSFISAEDFSAIFDYIERIMRKTGNAIADGDISVCPTDGRELPACKYCDFAAVCRLEDGKARQVPDLKNEEIFEMLGKGEENGI